MGRSYLVLIVAAAVVATPLLVGACALGAWLRRSNRSPALRPFLGMAAAGACSFFSMLGVVALLIAIAAREQRQPDYFEDHPLLPLLMFGLLLLALGTAFLAALFSVWMFWSAFRPGAAAAAAAPARSAG